MPTSFGSMKWRLAAAAGVCALTLVVAGCSTEDPQPAATSAEEHGDHTGDAGDSTESDGHAGMDHPMDGGPVPDGMTPAAAPQYPVGAQVILTADHMAGMHGAQASIVGAYDTYVYSVNYTTADGEVVEDHRWVVQEEIADAGDERLADGTEVTLTADHMDGMQGATATIASSTDETVYVVDYEADGMTMSNHKWVVDSEIEPLP